MNENKSWFERYLEAIQRAGDTMLAWQYQKDMMKASLLDNKDIDRIADRVLSRIRIRIETEAIAQLRDMLNEIGVLWHG